MAVRPPPELLDALQKEVLMAGRPLRRERIARENCDIRNNPDSKILWSWDTEDELLHSNTTPEFELHCRGSDEWEIRSNLLTVTSYKRPTGLNLDSAVALCESAFDAYTGKKSINGPKYVSLAVLKARHALKNPSRY